MSHALQAAQNNYAGTYTATPNTGTAATRAINMTVAAAGAAALNLSNCTSTNNTTSPTPASSTCTLSNTGSTAVSSISYTAPAGTTASGPTGSCAANSTCGNVTVTTSTAAGNYTGNLTATPNAGTAAVTGINLTVHVVAGAPALSLLSCSSNNFTTTPSKASTTCSLKNTGTVAINSISYSTPAGMSTTGPTGACAANTVCSTVVVSTGTTAGNYTGTLSISSVPAASSATNLAIDLTVNGINAETVTYLHTDGLGSPVAKSNASGVRIKQTKYEAYGMTVAGSDKPTIGFTGHYNDSDTELTYMQQRYYDPVAARFLSEDPVLTDQNTGASFNRYVYASNNPYRYIDPDGRAVDSVTVDKKNNVHIVIGLSFRGVGTQKQAAAFIKGIQEAWGGKHGKYAVNITVIPAEQAKRGNTLNLVQGTGVSGVTSQGGREGTIYEKDPAGATRQEVVNHEAGHLLGLKDGYDKWTYKPLEGEEGNIMAGAKDGKVEEKNITRIIERAKEMKQEN